MAGSDITHLKGNCTTQIGAIEIIENAEQPKWNSGQDEIIEYAYPVATSNW